MKIVINALPFSFARCFKFPIEVEATQLESGSFLVYGEEFTKHHFTFKYKQRFTKKFRETGWYVDHRHVIEVRDV